jgi:putative hydroxymethylpyrimidine transport system permease protein
MLFLRICLVWGLLSYLIPIPDIYLPSLVDVVCVLYLNLGSILYHLMVTSIPMIFGVGGAAIFACLKATRTHKKNQKSKLSDFLIISQAIPSFILMPLFLSWFGHGLFAKTIMVAFWSFVSIYISLLKGYGASPKNYAYLAQGYGLTAYQKILHFDRLHAMPNFLTGIKISLLHAPLTVLAAEWFGADQGLGYLFMLHYGHLNMPYVFALVLVLMGMIYCLYYLWKKVYEKIIFWVA